MQEGLIGVIVPVYKVEKYVAECIESILAQTYTKFRLILVDDGTPDNAGKICDEYAKKDPRITVIHQENSGVTRARARGVEETSDCEYIMFVDSDDTIATDLLEELYSRMTLDTDIVINEKGIELQQIKISDYLHILISADGSINLAPWNKLFRRNIFNEHTLDIPREIIVGEDMLMNIRLCFASKKQHINVINKDKYHYRISDNSVTIRHKRTPEYEILFQRNLIASIPVRELNTYFKYTIDNRVKLFMSFWGYKYVVMDMKRSEFYKELKADIENFKYKLNFINRVIFYNSCPVIRFSAINLKKARNLLQSNK